MKLMKASEIEELESTAFPQGIEYTVRELLTKGLVIHDTNRDTGASMKLFADSKKEEDVAAVVAELIAHSPVATDVDRFESRGYMRLVRQV